MKRYFMGTWNIALFVKKIIGWYGGNEEKRDSSVRGGCQRGDGTEEKRKRRNSPYVVGVREVLVRRKLEKSQNLRTTCLV